MTSPRPQSLEDRDDKDETVLSMSMLRMLEGIRGVFA